MPSADLSACSPSGTSPAVPRAATQCRPASETASPTPCSERQVRQPGSASLNGANARDGQALSLAAENDIVLAGSVEFDQSQLRLLPPDPVTALGIADKVGVGSLVSQCLRRSKMTAEVIHAINVTILEYRE